MRAFYMVYVAGSSSPTHRHNTREQAETEAKRLAKNLNKTTYVLRALHEIKPITQYHELILEDMNAEEIEELERKKKEEDEALPF